MPFVFGARQSLSGFVSPPLAAQAKPPKEKIYRSQVNMESAKSKRLNSTYIKVFCNLGKDCHCVPPPTKNHKLWL